MTKNTSKQLAALLLTLSLFATGCLKCDILLALSPDGSGYIESSYSITENATSQIRSMVKLGKQLDMVTSSVSSEPTRNPEMMLFLDPDENQIRKELAKYEKFGLVVNKLRVRSRNSTRFVDIRLDFKDIAKVAQADVFADIGFSLYRRKSGDLVFFRRNLNAGNPDKDILDSPEAQRMIAPILEGFNVTVKVHTPGRILDSNAHTRALKSATWTFDQDKDPKAFQNLQSQEYIILIDSTGITIPDIKIETKKAVEDDK